MRELEFLGKVLNDKFLQKGADALKMRESADDLHCEQIVDISNRVNDIIEMKLYCFNDADAVESKLLPFFNKNNDGVNKAPCGLNSFCDYILLAQHKAGLFIFLLELKRGTSEGAEEQLNASKTFMKYVLDSAERIKHINSFDDFDSSTIEFRRAIVKPTKSNKQITKHKDVQISDKTSCMTFLYNPGTCFHPIWYCE